MSRILLTIAILALLSCDDETIREGALFVCGDLQLRYDETRVLPGFDSGELQLLDGTVTSTALVVLGIARGQSQGSGPWTLLRLSVDGKELIESVQIPEATCVVASLLTVNDEAVALASCSEAEGELPPPEASGAYRPEAAALYQLTPDGFVKFEDVTTGPRLAAFAADHYYWFSGDVRVSPAPTEEGTRLLEPLGWGPTSGLDVIGETVWLARDAFEGGMRNMLAAVSVNGGSFCTLDVEDVPGLTGESGIGLFGDGERLWVFTRSGTVAAFRFRPDAGPSTF